jgi:hypothetical protein
MMKPTTECHRVTHLDEACVSKIIKPGNPTKKSFGSPKFGMPPVYICADAAQDALDACGKPQMQLDQVGHPDGKGGMIWTSDPRYNP